MRNFLCCDSSLSLKYIFRCFGTVAHFSACNFLQYQLLKCHFTVPLKDHHVVQHGTVKRATSGLPCQCLSTVLSFIPIGSGSDRRSVMHWGGEEQVHTFTNYGGGCCVCVSILPTHFTFCVYILHIHFVYQKKKKIKVTVTRPMAKKKENVYSCTKKEAWGNANWGKYFSMAG